MARAPRIAIDLEANVAGLITDLRTASQSVTNFTTNTRREISSTANTVEGLGRSISGAARFFRTAFAGFATGNIAIDLVKIADRYANLQQKIKVVTRSQEEYNRAYEGVQKIAFNTSASIESTAQTYQRLTQSLRDLNVPQNDVLKMTEAINKSFILSGATTQEATNAAIQLSQALASNRLSGDEFRSLAEQAPRLMRAFADSLGVPIGALRKMGQEGKLTAKVLTDALLEQAGSIGKDFETVPLTIERGFQRLKNSILIYVGEANTAAGSSAAIAKAISGLAENFVGVADAAFNFAKVIALIYSGKALAALSNWIMTQKAAIVQTVAARSAYADMIASSTAASAAKAAEARATLAVVEVARAELLVKIQANGVQLKAIQANIAAAKAAGAQSFAIRELTRAEAALIVTQKARAGMMTELAILGRQSVAIQRTVAASDAAVAAGMATNIQRAGMFRTAITGVGTALMAFAGGPVGVAVIAIAGLSYVIFGAIQRNREYERSLKDARDAMISFNKTKSESDKNNLQMANFEGKREQLISEVANLEARVKRIAEGGGNESAGVQLLSLAPKLEKKRKELADFNKVYEETAKALAEQAGRIRDEEGNFVDPSVTKAREDYEKLRDTLVSSVDPIRAAKKELADRTATIDDMAKKGVSEAEITDLRTLAQQDYEKAIAKTGSTSAKEAKQTQQRIDKDREYTQAFIDNIEARNEELNVELVTGENLSASQKDLIKFEYLLARSKNEAFKAQADNIRGMLQENIEIEKQIALRARQVEAELRALQVKRQIKDYQDQRRLEGQREIDAIRFGGNTAELNGRLNAVGDEFRSQRTRIDDDYSERLSKVPNDDAETRNQLQAEYNRLIGMTIIAETQQMAIEKQMFEDKLRAQSDWRNGAISAFQDYIAAAQDVAGATKAAFQSAFTKMEDLLVTFVTTGKANFKEFVVAVLTDFIRMETRIILSKIFEMLLGYAMKFISPAAGATTGTPGGGMGTGPAANGKVFSGGNNVQSFAGGGAFTNQVMNRSTYIPMAQLGEAGDEAIMPLARDSKGKLGVAASGAGAGGGVVATFQTNITVADGATRSSTSSDTSNKLTRELAAVVDGQFKEMLGREARPGGILWRMNNGG